MKKTMTAFLVGLVFLMPISLAEMSAKAEARSASVVDLRLNQVGQAFSDFAFNIRAALTFDNEAKLELLKQRNAELKSRQQIWVDAKQEALLSFKSSNMTQGKSKA